MSRLVNLTPHAIRLLDADGQTVALLPASGMVARVPTRAQAASPIAGWPTVTLAADPVEGLPGPTPGVWYVVSGLVADRVWRPDVLYPGALVRDDAGQVVGCRNLVRPPVRALIT